jgi:small subunit ribosomal protein S8
MITDQVADFLTRVRNAGRARLSKVDTFNSKMNRAIAEILAQEGYIKSFKIVQEEKKSSIRVYLKFEDGNLRKPLIQGIVRQSRPGLRRYVRADKMPKVMSGFGLAVLSTSKGVMSSKNAVKQGVGGEFLCSVW